MSDPDRRPVRLVLGIETSCDETAAAVIEDGRVVRSSVVSSQIDLHARYGGVVPEIAGRAHLRVLPAIIADAVGEAGITGADVDVVAATIGPGLIGSLLVGVSAAKALALVWDVPFVGVNHLEAHLYASLLAEPDLELPMLVLLVSGGHTMLVVMEDHGRLQVLGSTLDDAAGEAFDKVARYLGLGYPGGPAIDRLAREGDASAVDFPRAVADRPTDFSFSGLKTAVVNYVRRHPDAVTADVAASFQEAVVDVLVDKALAAAEEHDVASVCLGGGVAANSRLRERFVAACEADGRAWSIPEVDLCTDNAAMVAAAGHWQYELRGPTDLDAGADPSLPLV
jgi:N6-L-threonylcarbamoyladenine synthase